MHLSIGSGLHTKFLLILPLIVVRVVVIGDLFHVDSPKFVSILGHIFSPLSIQERKRKDSLGKPSISVK